MTASRSPAARRAQLLLLAAAVALPWTLATPPPADAAPNHKEPLYCGREFKGNSRPGHAWGLDIISTTGNNTKDQEVMATAGGTVSERINGNGQIRINHGGGDYSVYAHMRNLAVNVGDPVVAGQLLGTVYDTGDAMGYHLHYGQDKKPASTWVPQQVRFYNLLYGYFQNSSTYGPAIDSGHCPTPPATDIWDDDIVSPSRRTSIGWLYTQSPQITSGCGLWFDNPNKRASYCPEGIVARDQMASFLDRYLDLSDTSTDYFTDDEGNPHEQAINNIRAANITTGCGGTNYCPSGQVTRGQMATFLNRPLIISNTSNDYFTDDEGSTHEQAINNLAAVGITGGCPQGTNLYCPNGLVTRGQMADFLYRGRNYRP
jgi:Peptidase family M23/S-layer homology domain